ncbi:hypothetical protein K1T71_014640 [Dendrolimus kikuchii]|uniref:Uncharacterized protein n=1 Tax=Dendrolimus kikuchii TaxID=765133 RepID=A0ACC1CEZ5_9NEOP|nr:hypothetical protein K1T71_014640 [Dendrolimus kikuchii]
MNVARKICIINQNNITRQVYRTFRLSSVKRESTQASQTQIQEEKFEFEDVKIYERAERRKAQISPFMKDVFLSVFNRDLLAFPEIINKEEFEDLERRLKFLDSMFNDREKTKEDRINALKSTKMFAAPVPLTRNGLAINKTEGLRYLETIANDLDLGQIISDHWIGLEALKAGLTEEQYAAVVDDLTTGIWRISGEKVCKHTSGYLLVLCAVEASRLKAFLVHPKVEGVSSDGKFVKFFNTPATPLDNVKESHLAQILGISRLHAATLCRCSLKNAIHTVVDYVKPRSMAGKPLSELSTIRAAIGDALLDLYASESAEYFTAGLIDGYMEPDAELEMAMCRNFMASHGLSSVLKLLSIPALDKELECKRQFDDMRHLASRGETLDSVNMFIALNGIHHAGKLMAQEIKQIRNPLFNPTFIIRKIFENRHQEKDAPKLTLYLAEHLHPTLKQPAEQLEYCVLRMKFACETLMARHGIHVSEAYTELERLAEAATEILVMTSVLSRASRAYCIGLRNAEVEMKLAACFVERTKDRVKKLILEIDDGEFLNLDHFRCNFGKKILDTNTVLVEKPTARTFW